MRVWWTDIYFQPQYKSSKLSHNPFSDDKNRKKNESIAAASREGLFLPVPVAQFPDMTSCSAMAVPGSTHVTDNGRILFIDNQSKTSNIPPYHDTSQVTGGYRRDKWCHLHTLPSQLTVLLRHLHSGNTPRSTPGYSEDFLIMRGCK